MSLTLFYDKTNRLHFETFDDPCAIEYHENGKVSKQIYKSDGKIHRDGDKPALIKYDENGNITFEMYYQNGKRFRGIDKVSAIGYSKGNVIWECFDRDDDTKPETIEYLEDGRELHYWVKNGVYTQKYIDVSSQLTKACRD